MHAGQDRYLFLFMWYACIRIPWLHPSHGISICPWKVSSCLSDLMSKTHLQPMVLQPFGKSVSLKTLCWWSASSSSLQVLWTLFLLSHMLTMLFLTLFYLQPTCIHPKANMPFTHVYLIFALCFTCVHLKANTLLYLSKSVVRQLYSLAFH